MVMAKPMQLTNVKPVPFNSGGMEVATKLENCGESAVTAIPHKHHIPKNRKGDAEKRSGEHKQHSPEMDKATNATLLLPNFRESIPPIPHEIPPSMMTMPVHKETGMLLDDIELKPVIAKGVNAQNAYSSHIWPK